MESKKAKTTKGVGVNVNVDEFVRHLLRCYCPVHADCINIDEGAQLVESQWYIPRYGSNTLQHEIGHSRLTR